MKLTRLLALLTCLMTLAFFSGCTQKYQHDETGLYAKNNQGFNALGIVDSSPQSFRDVPNTTVEVQSDELVKRKNISGDNVSLLWGAINYADY